MPDTAGSRRNWAGNVTYGASSVVAPTSVPELQELVAASPRIRAIGTRHSFSTVADAPGVQVDLSSMPRTLEIDTAASTMRVDAATRWGELAPALHAAGYAVHTLGSLPHISVAGSVATGTHGSGDRHGCLASAVVALELVGADGELRRISRGEQDFAGSVVALGALGIVTAVTLEVQPTYDVEQTVLDGLSWEVALRDLDAVMASASSVSLFTRWQDEVEQVWVKRRTDEPAPDLAWTGARRADGARHPVPGVSPTACTVQDGVAGPWFERVPHFRLDHTPSSGDELQTEYLVAREHGPAALAALHGIRHRIAPVLQIGELRTVAADDLWLSMAQGRDSLAIHFTWVADTDAVRPVVADVERALSPFDPRPHWGKVFELAPEQVAAVYPRFGDAAELIRRSDPASVFGNAFVSHHLDAAQR